LALRRSALFLAAVLAGAAGCRSRDTRPTNLLLISLDTLRVDRMSAYGGPRPTTPAIEKLAARGVRFDNAFSPSPWTLPAHAAMLSGRYPSSLAPDPNDTRLYRVAPSLAHMFARKGYRTGAVTGGGYVSKSLGADRGFESFDQGPAAMAVAWLEEHRDEPFFLFFHTYVAHVPYRDRRFVTEGQGGRLAGLFPGGAATHSQPRSPNAGLGADHSPDEKEFVVALYDGGVAAADEQVGTLLATLDKLGLADRTAVVVTSDHGEEFWDHTGAGATHGHTLYAELLRVPLVWYEPGRGSRGTVVDTPVSLVDLVPTCVARFGLDRPPRLDGVDLSPLLDGEDRHFERSLFAEAVRRGPDRMSVWNGDGKLILVPNPTQQKHAEARPIPVRATRELYLPDDREERHDVAGAEPERLRRLTAELEAHQRAATTTEPPGRMERPDSGTIERLKALGYVQ
jgi:arylsulfatase A-like enzyme